MKIENGTLWEDCDMRSCYDVLPDGTYPVPDTYEGPVDIAHRVVRIVGDSDPDYVRVENVHNGKRTVVQRKSFYPSGINNQGRRRTQGFVPAETGGS